MTDFEQLSGCAESAPSVRDFDRTGSDDKHGGCVETAPVVTGFDQQAGVISASPAGSKSQ